MTMSASFDLPPIIQIIQLNAEEYSKALKTAREEAEQTQKKTQTAFEKMNNLGGTMKSIGNKMTLGVTAPLTLLGTTAYNAYKSFDDAFRGVIKTTDLTTEEMASMKQEIRDMAKELPFTVEEISNVIEAAGQLGISKENLTSFAREMLAMGVSTNMSATESAEAIARFSNITGMAETDAGRLGSVIVALGNNFATTEQEVMEMGLRLAGAGSQVGMTNPQILALATALSSVGINAEAGGSAMSKLILNMRVSAETGEKAQQVIASTGYSLRDLQMMASLNKDEFMGLAQEMGYTKEELEGFVQTASTMENWATVTGKSTQEFATIMKEDAVGGLMAFLNGLAQMEDQGDSAIVMLDQMGIKEVRLRDAILRSTGAVDMMSDALALGDEAWESNIALGNEASLFYDAESNKAKVRANQQRDAMLDLGKAVQPIFETVQEVIIEIANAFNSLDEGTQKGIVQVGLFVAAAGPLLSIGGTIVKAVGGIGTALAGLGGASATASTALATAGTAATGTATAIATGTTAMGGLLGALGSAAIAVAPYAVAIGGVALAGKAIYDSFTAEAIPSVDLFATEVTTATTSVVNDFGRVSSAYTDHERQVVTSTVTISQETQAQLGAWMTMHEGVLGEMNNMYIGVNQINSENIGNITTGVNQLAEDVISAYRKQKKDSIEEYRLLFEGTETMTGLEQAELINMVTQHHDERIQKTRELRDELNGIYKGIKDGSIDYTASTQQQITDLMNQLKENSVNAMAQNESEQAVILNRLSAHNGQVTREMVSETVIELNKQRDESIRLAGEERDEKVRIANELRNQLPNDMKHIADELINEANRTHDESVEAYQGLRDNGLYKMREAYGDVVNDVDTYTGRIVNFLDTVNGTANRFRDDWNNMKLKDFKTTVTTEYKTIGNPTQYTNSTRNVTYMSHYNGLDAVPYDNYMARLHKGERVLTAREAEEYKNQENGKGFVVSIENFVNNREQDVKQLADELMFYINQKNFGRG